MKATGKMNERQGVHSFKGVRASVFLRGAAGQCVSAYGCACGLLRARCIPIPLEFNVEYGKTAHYKLSC